MKTLFGILLLGLLASSCSRESYWEQSSGPSLILAYNESATPPIGCHPDWLGCYNWATGHVWVKTGLSPALHQCVIDHEYHHAAGYTHHKFDNETTAGGVDCGDGNIVPVA